MTKLITVCCIRLIETGCKQSKSWMTWNDRAKSSSLFGSGGVEDCRVGVALSSPCWFSADLGLVMLRSRNQVQIGISANKTMHGFCQKRCIVSISRSNYQAINSAIKSSFASGPLKMLLANWYYDCFGWNRGWLGVPLGVTALCPTAAIRWTKTPLWQTMGEEEHWDALSCHPDKPFTVSMRMLYVIVEYLQWIGSIRVELQI